MPNLAVGDTNPTIPASRYPTKGFGMNNGKITFSKCGSDEVVGSYPMSQGIYNLARVRLTKANNTDVLGDPETLGLYVAYLAAKLARIKGVPDLKPNSVTAEDLFIFNTIFDFELEAPETLDESEGVGQEIDENPTDTLPESSEG